MNQTHLTTLKFDELKLDESLLKGLTDAGFTYCTPIQAEALPVALRGEDVAGQAQTGTGKTAAFLLALFNQLLSRELSEAREEPYGKTAPRAIVIAPTRELALQIHHDAELLGRYTGLRLALAYGGTDYEKQREAIAAGVEVLVGTPGRLIDYLKQGIYTLDQIEVVVLDEADRMFDLGFIKDMRYMLRRMPPPDRRLNMLFSATLSHRVMELAYEHMNDPRTVAIAAEGTVAENIREVVYYPSNAEKIPLMVGLLEDLTPGRTLVFTNTRHGAEKVGDWLNANGQSASVLTGDVPQKKRESLLRAFTEGRCNILVATDVAARGLHIPDVSHVFNFDLPQDPEDYVHRIGRTARAGASGDAVSFACEDYAFGLVDIEEFIGHAIPRGEIEPDLLPELTRPARGPRESQRSGSRGASGVRGRGADDDRRRRGGEGEESRRRRPAEPRERAGRPEVLDESTAVADDTTSRRAPEQVSAEPVPERVMNAAPDITTIDTESADSPENGSRETPRISYRKGSKWNNPNIETPAIG